jgi:hypothetical protein
MSKKIEGLKIVIHGVTLYSQKIYLKIALHHINQATASTQLSDL